ncbi:MAG TPA: 5-methyltetrahydropteroyltriglutamate--homocysteine S-methyltransferase, partial [Gemmatimonadota bacterium]|nr:5-methyltetrahydropteroyltriglutamate--homocysteine S-methyltransferase [Gemmatimonadota bacterium]
MALATNLGYPRIGRDRELKRATEAYWAGKLSREDLLAEAARLRLEQWRSQRSAGIDHVPSNVFSLYDHVLDMAALVGAVPPRYRWSGEEIDLDTYFAMARGAQGKGLDAPAMEMTKWFDTNYHYIVPELAPDQGFQVASRKPFDELAEASAAGIPTRPVLLGPVSFLLLAKPTEPGFEPLRLLDPLTETMAEVVRRLAEAGAEWIQIDEPCLVQDRSPEEIAALGRAYGPLDDAAGTARLLLQTYFGDVGPAWETLTELPVAGIGLDLVRGSEDPLERRPLPADKMLSAGIVDGRNVWINDLEASLGRLERIAERIGPERLLVAPSCSLIHVPIEAARETELDPELRGWLAFADEKLAEVATLARGLAEGREAIADELAANRDRLASRAASERTRD